MSRQTRSGASTRAQRHSPSPTQPPLPNHPDLPPDLLPADPAIGTPLLLPKPDEWTCIYVQNPNGLSIGASGDLSLALENLRDAECDIMMFPETNLATDQTYVKSQVHHECKMTFGHGRYKLALSHTTVSYSSSYKPGVLRIE